MSSLNGLFIHNAILSIRSHIYSTIILFPKSYKKNFGKFLINTTRPNELFQIFLDTRTIFLDLDTLIK